MTDGLTAAVSATNLPASFWQARPELAHVRQAAHSRNRSADAVLGAVLARVAALVPPTVQLPAIVGSVATVDLLVAVVAPSGAGKSSAVAIAGELLPINDESIVADFQVGSGEGLVDAFLGSVEELAANGKTARVRRQVHRAVLAVVDEGQILAELSSRRGSTLLPTLRSAWSGAALGQGNASAETNRRLPRLSYRLAAIIALQPEHAGALLEDAAGGTPQRLVWLSATDPSIPDDGPAWPGRLDLEPPSPHHYGMPFYVPVAGSVAREIKTRDTARQRGENAASDPLDAHADLVRLKVAALLAVLGNRLEVTADDWHLAGVVMGTSRTLRTEIAETLKLDARRKEDASNAKAGRREVAVLGTVESRALGKAARAVGKRVHRDAGAVVARGRIAQAIASRDRAYVSVDDVIAEAERIGFIVATADGWTAGDSRPT